MSDIAIKVENLSKQYHIGQLHKRHDTLRDALIDGLQRFRRTPQPDSTDDHETIWALKDVSFEVKRGEVVGIIGRNGAGKSTLLKILSRITEPTSGEARIYGRIGSLLEVGTGFHLELTGRENIFFSGAMLGMRREEIIQRFDEIVEFSGVGKFIDTPIKRYSSGMNVRLGFAVAAHLEPEVLMVDEVLAVGDVEFQKKCLGKMGDVAREGRTVLFVSHNMAAVQALCARAISLHNGTIAYTGETTRTIAAYLSSFNDSPKSSLTARFTDKEPDMLGWYTDIRFCSSTDSPISTAISGQAINIVLSYRTKAENLNMDFGIGIYTMMGEKVLYFSTKYSYSNMTSLPQSGEVICHIPRLPLPEGSYLINITLRHKDDLLDLVPGSITLRVQSGDFYGTGKVPPASEHKVLADHNWIFPTNVG